MATRPRRPRVRSTPARRAPTLVPFASMKGRPTEWVGGRVTLPGVRVRGHRGAVEAVLWLAGVLVVDIMPLPPRAPRGALAEGLARALAQPNAPRPASVRVADPRAVPSLEAVLGPTIPVRVGPTPELDAVLAQIMQGTDEAREAMPLLELVVLADEDPVAGARFFEHAAALYRTAPWDVLPSDEHVLAVDAPELGWNDLCVCVVGQAGESYGVLWFASAEAYAAFRAASERVVGDDDADDDEPPRDLGARFFAVNYERAAEVPAALRQEFAARAWPIAGPAAVPMLMLTEPDATPAPLTRDDLARAAVLCDVLARFFAEHGAALRADETAAREGRYAVEGARGLEVRVRYPHPRYGLPVADLVETDEERATRELLATWTPEFARRFPSELTAALDDTAYALLDRRPTRRDGARLEPMASSLPEVWAAVWRPMADGRTGLEVCARDARFASLAAARDRVARARVLYGEVLAVDAGSGVVVVRDLFDGARHRVVGVAREQLRQYARWMRVFGVLLPREDGAWAFPSVFVAAPHFARVEPGALVAGVAQTLRALGGRADDLDAAAPRAGLLRHAAIALGVLHRLADEAERAAPPPPEVFFCNTDGEAAEFHDVEVAIALDVRRVVARMAAAEDFEQVDARAWDRIDRTRTENTPLGESVGQLARVGRRWFVRGNSAGRVDRLLERLAAVLGERPVERRREVTAPWRGQPGVARAPGDGVRTVVIASGPAGAASDADPGAFVAELHVAALRRALDRHVDEVGGVPREMVATERGRAAVERWLREAEAQGLPPQSPTGRMLDLDPIRAELGLALAGEA